MEKRIEGKLYPAKEIGSFFGKTTAWFYWCQNNKRFVYENGEVIPPTRSTVNGGRKQYDLDAIKEMALSLYRFRQIKESELKEVLKKILIEREKETGEKID